MGKKKKAEEKIVCVAYLSVNGDMYSVDKREQRQLRYIKEYAAGHNIEIRKVLHKDVMGQSVVNRHFEIMLDMIIEGKVQGIILSNMLAVASSLPDAYYKVGKVREAGGCIVTVDEGKLALAIKEAK